MLRLQLDFSVIGRRPHDNICNIDAVTGGKTFEIYPEIIL